MSLLPDVIISSLKPQYPNTDKVKDIITTFAAASAEANSSSFLPVTAIMNTVALSNALVCRMYSELSKTLGISLDEDTIKLIAKTSLAAIAWEFKGTAAVSFISMLIPGVCALTSGAVGFASVYLSGYMFLVLVHVFASKSKDIHSFSDIPKSEIESAAKSIEVTSEDIARAKAIYNAVR